MLTWPCLVTGSPAGSWTTPPRTACVDLTWDKGGRGHGVATQRSETKLAEITDGTIYTFMLGEKFLEPSRYETTSHGDHHGMYILYWDTWRYAGDEANLTPLQDADLGTVGQMRDVNSCCTSRFGSAHPGGMHMSMCDGSVHTISYSIDTTIYRNLGDRDDAVVFNDLPRHRRGDALQVGQQLLILHSVQDRQVTLDVAHLAHPHQRCGRTPVVQRKSQRNLR